MGATYLHEVRREVSLMTSNGPSHGLQAYVRILGFMLTDTSRVNISHTLHQNSGDHGSTWTSVHGNGEVQMNHNNADKGILVAPLRGRTAQWLLTTV